MVPCRPRIWSRSSASVRCSRADSVVDGGCLLPFCVGQGLDAERQDFIDLRAVEKIAGAFVGDLRIIVQDDRRRQHRVGVARSAHQHRPGADVPAAPGGIVQILRRIGE